MLKFCALILWGYHFGKWYSYEGESDEHGNYLKYQLVVEYNTKPPLPPPLTFIYYVSKFIWWIWVLCCKGVQDSQRKDTKVPLSMFEC